MRLRVWLQDSTSSTRWMRWSTGRSTLRACLTNGRYLLYQVTSPHRPQAQQHLQRFPGFKLQALRIQVQTFTPASGPISVFEILGVTFYGARGR